MPQRLKAIACGVFENELRAAAQQSPHQVHLHMLDAGLHARPDELRRQAQAAIDDAEAELFDALLICYGLCGRGVVGLRAKGKPLVIPRVHDCISLFLGSRHEYRRQFAAHPGTYYITSGWYEQKAGNKRSRFRPIEDAAGAQEHPKFREYADRYGQDNAVHILHFFDSWKRNYTRAAFIDLGLGDSETYARFTQEIADDVGWQFERIPGSLHLIEKLVAGDWPKDDFLVAPPGHRIVGTGKNDLFEAVPVDGAAESSPGQAGPSVTVRCAAPPARPKVRLPSLGLGIDAGGTYTDSVLYDFEAGQPLGKAKALTTPHDYAEGITKSVAQLDHGMFGRIDLVCLSTTLATNAIVEGRGARVGLILMPHHPDAVARIDVPLCIVVPGRIDITGRQIKPLDEEQVREAVQRLIHHEQVDAIAISGFGGTRNPAHELRVKEIVSEHAAAGGINSLPVVCGHELSSKLDFIKRAHTAALNAKLLPVIEELIASVRAALGQLGIHAALMIVKGDGTLVSERMARTRPIETVLSGPAASATGAVFLTGEADAVAIDMGGTTTDTALIRDGQVTVSAQGARVGGWRTSVDAVDMLTTGLGGDSLVGLDRDGHVTVGPTRAVPLAYLARQAPGVGEILQDLAARAEYSELTPECLDFFVQVRADGRARLDARETEILQELAAGPQSRLDLGSRLGYMAPSLLRTQRLEQLGYVRRSALTPTDVLHFTGEFEAWDREAAAHAVALFASMMHRSPQDAAACIRHQVVRGLTLEVIRRYVSLTADPRALDECDVCRLFMDNLLDGERQDEFACRFDLARPIVAIGAPVRAFMPAVGEALSAKVIIPDHADVANAIGAITSKVVVGESASIRPSDTGDYIVHTSVEKREFDHMAHAREFAESVVVDRLRSKAPLYGTDESSIRLRVEERQGKLATGEQVFLEMTIEGTIEGQPVLVD